MVYFEDTCFKVGHNQDLKTAEIVWKGESACETHYKMVLTKSLVLTKLHDLSLWVCDLTSVVEMSDEEKIWFKEVLIPSIAADGVKKIVLIINNNIYSEKDGREFLAIAKRNSIAVHYCYSFEEANKWIADIQ